MAGERAAQGCRGQHMEVECDLLGASLPLTPSIEAPQHSVVQKTSQGAPTSTVGEILSLLTRPGVKNASAALPPQPPILLLPPPGEQTQQHSASFQPQEEKQEECQEECARVEDELDSGRGAMRTDWDDLPSVDELNSQIQAEWRGGRKRPGLLLQYHDRPSPPHPQLREHNRLYAQRHGYDYLLHTGEFNEGPMSPYWGKVKAVLESLPLYSYVLFLDTDAVVHDIDVQLDALFEEGKEFVYSSDIPLRSDWSSPFCAGVFCVRSSLNMIEMLRRWLSLYPASKWWVDQEDGLWHTKGEWAGGDYEQGAFVDYFLQSRARSDEQFRRNQQDFGHLLQPVSHLVLQGDREFRPQPECVTLHFAGTEEEGKKRIGPYLEERLEAHVARICASVGLSMKLEDEPSTGSSSSIRR